MTISAERSIKAYCLMHDTETMNSELGSHAQLVPFEGYEEVSTVMSDLVEPVEFHGLLSTVRQTDFPVVEEGWPLMSKRMLEVLESVSFFPHRVLPTRILEGSIDISII